MTLADLYLERYSSGLYVPSLASAVAWEWFRGGRVVYYCTGGCSWVEDFELLCCRALITRKYGRDDLHYTTSFIIYIHNYIYIERDVGRCHGRTLHIACSLGHLVYPRARTHCSRLSHYVLNTVW